MDIIRVPSNNRSCGYESHKVDKISVLVEGSLEEMSNIAHEIKGMTQEMAIMNRQNNNIMRILLVVVCIIALGRAASEIKDVFISKVVAEGKTE